MDWIEQAVFTSAETDRSAGYQVVATSPGLSDGHARELAVWGPSHNALLEPGLGAVSYNFHSCQNGSHCVGRTTSAGWEYSGRGGVRVYTQCLIVRPSTLARFGNNPFALLRAALASGVLRVHDRVPERLAPLRLAGRAPVVDQALLARLCANPGPDWLAALMQAALTSANVAIVGGPPAEHLIAGLVNCLPPECRLEFSFSTGLKYSSRRPYRVIALSQDEEEQRRVKRLYDVAVLDFSGPVPAELAPVESWARFIHRALKTGRTSLLANHLSRRQCEFAPEDLPALGLQLLEELDASSLADEDADEDAHAHEEEAGHLLCEASERPLRPDVAVPFSLAHEDRGDDSDEPERLLRLPEDPPAVTGPPDEDTWLSHVLPMGRPPSFGTAPHDGSRFSPLGDPSGPPTLPLAGTHQQAHEGHAKFHGDCVGPASAIHGDATGFDDADSDDPEVVERLEHLDDLVYDAIAGKPAALERLKAFWPQVRDAMHDELLAESKDQYLRCALSTWIESIQSDAFRDPGQAAQSLEVLCVLFDQV